MSEPTGDDKQQPDPEQQPEAAPGNTQDETSGSVFNDPTAPVWADPTALMTTTPIPATPVAEVPSAWVQDTPEPPLVPPTPPGVSSPYGQQPPTPQAVPPVSNPYAQQPPAPPYGQPPAPPYGQPPAPPYGQQYPGYGQQYPGYGQQYYAPGAPAVPSNTSAIVLTIVSGVSMLSTAFFVGIPSLIFGIMALNSNATDPVGSRRKSRIGWIIYAVNVGIIILLIVGAIALFVISGTSSTTFDSGY